MQFSQLISLLAVSASVLAADSQEIAFVTNLVSDAKANSRQYLEYYATATQLIPQQFVELAQKIQTYTDDSYTTLITDNDVDVEALESFAKAVPWASRLHVEAATTANASVPTSAPNSSASAPISAAPLSSANATTHLWASSSSRTAHNVSTTVDAGAFGKVAPVGAVIGAVAVALM